MSVRFSDVSLELEYSSGVWTDVYTDVVGGVRVSAGIRGNGPLDRIASTGTMTFNLINEDNVYTPTHVNCTSGFIKGTACRLSVEYGGTTRYKFYGRISKISVVKGDGIVYYTQVTVVDYMDILARHELQLPTYATSKRMDEIVPLIIANLDIAPLSTSYGTGQDTYEAVFDTTGGNARALQELSKVTLSELGLAFVTPSNTSAEVLTTRGRYGHSSATSAATFDDEDLSGISVSYGENYYNHLKTIVYPRQIDAAATSVLFTLQRYVAISAGATVKIVGRFVDPNQEAQGVTGTDMVAPVATTDYLFNTQSDGSGADITADLVVSATYGTNGVEYELTNNNADLGYVTFLQARGKGIYMYRPVEHNTEYSTGITADGRVVLNLQLPYHDNPLVGEDFASVLLDLYKTKRLKVDSITYDVDRDTTTISYFRDLYIGNRITLNLSDLNITGDYFIQGMDFHMAQNGSVVCTYIVIDEALLPASDYWELDSITKSQLGETTKIGF